MAGQVIIIGVGALGSHLALFGRNWKHGLKVIDFDRVEQKNIASQFHTGMGKARNKAFALQQAMQGLFGIKVDAIPHKLTQDNASTLLNGAALVIDCTDNVEARKVILDTVKANGVPCLHGAMSADGTLGRIIWAEQFVPDAEGTPGQATCEDGENLPFHGIMGAHLAWTAQHFLRTGKKASFQVTPTAIIRLA